MAFNNCDTFPFVFLPVVEEPLLSKLSVSNATSASLSLTWEAQDKAFDHFILEVRNSDFPLDSLVLTVPGDSRHSVVTNLKAATNYTVQLHGVIDGQGGQTLTAMATTGTSPFHLPGLLFILLSLAVQPNCSKMWLQLIVIPSGNYREITVRGGWNALRGLGKRSEAMGKAEKVPPALREPAVNHDWFPYIYTPVCKSSVYIIALLQMVDAFHSASLHLVLNEVVRPTPTCFAGGGRPSCGSQPGEAPACQFGPPQTRMSPKAFASPVGVWCSM